ncbi:MAG: methyltransferase family protein, partial [Candidatus Binatia bacterium]
MTPENVASLPPQLVIYQLAIGHYFSRALCLAAKLGIPDLLKDGPRRIGELAEATGTHAPSLHRVLRLLASVGVFEERESGELALTAVGECLRADAPGSARAMALLFSGARI